MGVLSESTGVQWSIVMLGTVNLVLSTLLVFQVRTVLPRSIFGFAFRVATLHGMSTRQSRYS